MPVNDPSPTAPNPQGTGAANASGIQVTPPTSGPTAIQAVPPADTPPASSRRLRKPPRPPMTPQQVVALATRLDVLLVGLVLVFAFLCGSFAAHNSDLWQHLAAGRLVAQGTFPFGSDPFCFTTAGVYWANHAWLYDLITYGLFQSFGGTPLVVLKALLVVALAIVLLTIRRPGQSVWIPVVFTALAVLVLSPRLYLQPTVVSMLLLGITLALLFTPRLIAARAENAADATRWQRLHLWLLPPLFVLWVNLDSWFFLGPLTVALYLVGGWLQDRLQGRTGPATGRPTDQWRTVALVFVVGLVACLLNPYHYHAFTLPPELSFDVPRDVVDLHPQLRLFYENPWENLQRDVSVAGISYLLLLALGLASFGANYRQVRIDRLLVWLVFSALSIYSVRLVSFFAVVAGPITALNFQDFDARAIGAAALEDVRLRRWLLGGRVLTLLAALGLVAAAWPGMLQSRTSFNRHVAWEVVPDAGYVQAAEQMHQWHTEQGAFGPEDHGLLLSADFANYCAWYCPEEKGFLDLRLHLFGEAIPDFVAVSRELTSSMMGGEDPRTGQPRSGQAAIQVPPEVYKILKTYKVNHVGLVEGTGQVRLWLADDLWSWVYGNGRICVFALKQKGVTPLKVPPLDMDRLAFGRATVKAPEQGPGREPEEQEPWDWYAWGPPRRSVGGEDARLFNRYFQTMVLRNQARIEATGELGYLVGMYQQGLLQPGIPQVPSALLEVGLLDRLGAQFRSTTDQGPPGALFVAIRAARRALKENPDDATAYIELDAAYEYLTTQTRQKSWLVPGLRMEFFLTRQIQVAAVLQRALALRPRDAALHEKLAQILEDGQNYDSSLEHWRKALEYTPTTTTLTGLEQEQQKKITRLEEKVKRMDEGVRRLTDVYLKDTVGQPVQARAAYALKQGLPEQALKVLEPDFQRVKEDQTQVPETIQQLNFKVDILIREGRLREANDILQAVGNVLPDDDRFRFLIAAADGSYAEADERLERMVARQMDGMNYQVSMVEQHILFKASPTPPELENLVARSMASLVLSQAILDQPIGFSGAVYLRNTMEPVELAGLVSRYRALQSNGLALRGLLAVEAGDLDKARDCFRRIQAFSYPGGKKKGPDDVPSIYTPGLPIADYYLEVLDKAAK